FSKGDPIPIECPTLTPNGTLTTTYAPGPLCVETGEELVFPFGVDALVRCAWRLDKGFYLFLRNVLENKASFQCRMPLSKEKSLYMPFTFTLWGEVEDTHIHLMNHLTFVFHVYEGFFLGATAYALRDHYVLGAEDSIIIMHGPARWFVGHSFEPFPSDDDDDNSSDDDNQTIDASSSDSTEDSSETTSKGNAMASPIPADKLPRASVLLSSVPWTIVVMYCAITAVVSVGVCALVYIGVLKPMLISQFKKKK
ncbi:hypothetical protein HK102_011449, partial [Quaeritorhiza haematococci]